MTSSTHYFPASRPALDADLAQPCPRVPDGSKADRGAAIGAAAARRDDRLPGRRRTSRHVHRLLEGTRSRHLAARRQPGWLFAWLGFVDPVIDVTPVALDGTDSLTSAAYSADYNEVRRRRLRRLHPAHGRADRDRALLREQPGRDVPRRPVPLPRRRADGALPATRMFARIDAAVADLHPDLAAQVRRRVLAAVPGDQLADTDANPGTGSTTPAGRRSCRTRPTPTTPAVTPAATAPFAEVVRQTLGDDMPLVLRAAGRPAPSVRDADRPRARCAQRTHLGWSALPRRHGRRLLPRPHDGGPGDARAALTGGQGVWSRIRERTPWEELPGAPPTLGWGCCRAACPTGRSP